MQNLGEMLVSVAGIATLGFGALRVSNGAMTTGALIGTMALVGAFFRHFSQHIFRCRELNKPCKRSSKLTV